MMEKPPRNIPEDVEENFYAETENVLARDPASAYRPLKYKVGTVVWAPGLEIAEQGKVRRALAGIYIIEFGDNSYVVCRESDLGNIH